jgi:hypothetical protein
MSDPSAKEMERRERFRPSASEIAEMRRHFDSVLSGVGFYDALEDWIEAETDRRITESCYDNGFPFPKKVKK